MGKPVVHAKSSARLFGGKWEDYVVIHDFMDSSKGAVADNRHRAMFHNSWAIAPDGILERIFGKVLKNSSGIEVPTRSIFEQHIMEDFGFIPTLQDYFEGMKIHPWMSKRGLPPSLKGGLVRNDD